MKLYDLMATLIMMDTEDIVLKDANLEVLKTGDFETIMDFSIDNDVEVEGLGTYQGKLVIILCY